MARVRHTPIDLLASDTTGVPLFDVEGTRRVEAAAVTAWPTPSLMERAGLAVARLALAVEPHARAIVVAVGPGNNGGDGLVAARHLHLVGKRVHAVWCRDGESMPAQARAAFEAARAAGVPMGPHWPAAGEPSLVIDALLGIGARGEPRGSLADLWRAVAACASPRLAVDVPSGLDADRGTAGCGSVLEARDTLALLTVKPGLFMAQGRDASGRIWFDDLGTASVGSAVPIGSMATIAPSTATAPTAANAAIQPIACLAGRGGTMPERRHAHHKGSFGDVVAVGGARGMTGALMLASRSALVAGAGRVYAITLGGDAGTSSSPDVMWRDTTLLTDRITLGDAVIVAGCGGGAAIGEVLASLLSTAPRIVIDADGLNALAADPMLAALAQRRAARGAFTVLTPHPLEAARLLGLPDARAVQADRLAAARSLATRFAAVVVLKGSGTVTTDGRSTWVNPSGNALLATAGTGDVLAGWIAGRWSAGRATICAGADLARTVASAVWEHGRAADVEQARGRRSLEASGLIDALTGALPVP